MYIRPRMNSIRHLVFAVVALFSANVLTFQLSRHPASLQYNAILSTSQSQSLPAFQRTCQTPLRAATLDDEVLVDASEQKKLPVTVLSGFLGSGKTTLLNHILKADHGGVKYAVIVNDMSEVNIDAKLVGTSVQHQEEEMVEMSNGCVCCTLREDLLREVARLAKTGSFDHLIIESTGISEPLPVAETFTISTEEIRAANEATLGNNAEDEPTQGLEGDADTASGNDATSNLPDSLIDVADIHSMVTVVDASNFIDLMNEANDLASMDLQATEEDARTVTDLLVSQVEFASVIILNKCDLIDAEQRTELIAYLRTLNAEARIIESTFSKVDIGQVVGSKSFDLATVSQSPAWLQAINDHEEGKVKVPETEEYGIGSFVYRARRPFHPMRLSAFLCDDMGCEPIRNAADGAAKKMKVLRSKGFFWLASRSADMLVWEHAGGLFRITPGGQWWADTPREVWPEEEGFVESIMSDWDDAEDEDGVGDRRQELVFIGIHLNKDALIAELDGCLLTDLEMGNKNEWCMLEDPFPVQEADDGSEDREEYYSEYADGDIDDIDAEHFELIDAKS